jgi:hypothetical protein
LNGGRDLGMLQAHAHPGPPAVAHIPNRPCPPRWGSGSGDAACGVDGVSLYRRGEHRDWRLLREYGDERPSGAHETGAVQGHFTRLRPKSSVAFPRPPCPLHRPRSGLQLLMDAWHIGRLPFREPGCRSNRSLPPYSQPHRRLISEAPRIRTPLDRVPAYPARL